MRVLKETMCSVSTAQLTEANLGAVLGVIYIIVFA